MKKKFYLFLMMLLVLGSVFLQEKSKGKNPFKLNVAADLMSRYVWRGADYGASPSIQPTLSVAIGNLEIGNWGAFAINSDYEEFDPYLKYSFNGFSAIITDYYIPCLSSSLCDNRWLVYKDNNTFKYDTTYDRLNTLTTSHALEGTLQYKGTEKFPISVLVASYFYGNDKKFNDTVFLRFA